jgi:hypothetical protein
MKSQRLLIVLTVVNLALLIFTLAQMHPAAAQGATSVLRGRALEIVDEHVRVRASIQVLPAIPQHGELSSETVLLRLITEKGRPSVKIASSEQTAGLSLAPLEHEGHLRQLRATGTVSSLKLKNEDGRELIIMP